VTVIVCDRLEQPIGASCAPPGYLRSIQTSRCACRDTLDPNDSRRGGADRSWLGYVRSVFHVRVYATRSPDSWLPHVCVDLDRRRVPCTDDESSPIPSRTGNFWNPLCAPIRQAVCVVGAESTARPRWLKPGKPLRTSGCPNTAGIRRRQDAWQATPWRSEEFVHIASAQSRREMRRLGRQPPAELKPTYRSCQCRGERVRIAISRRFADRAASSSRGTARLRCGRTPRFAKV